MADVPPAVTHDAFLKPGIPGSLRDREYESYRSANPLGRQTYLAVGATGRGGGITLSTDELLSGILYELRCLRACLVASGMGADIGDDPFPGESGL